MTEALHSDTVLVDRLTAWLNEQTEVSGGDAVEVICELIAESGRPLLNETWEVCADVEQDRYGISTAVTEVGGYQVRVGQDPDAAGADVVVSIDTPDGDDFGLAISVNGRRILDPMTCTWRSSVPEDLQITPPAPPRRR
ncbi:hypothetical protein [Catelliglobosispora koreensis]|uniref:hypothetical protein n=1 Tax=Catelliglobosispora koreensis TaxID=129052 RepID=UPI00037CECA0|nr:hypothetical protein [Catelliglobosispora koreensis]